MNRFITVWTSIVCFLACSWETPSAARDSGASAGLDVATVQEFDVLDRDRDGTLSPREFAFSEVAERLYEAGKRNLVSQVFESIDTSKNGGIELLELVQSPQNRNARLLDRTMSRSFIRSDTNQDGTIDLKEYSERPSANLDIFGKIDLNDNDKIGPFEWIHEYNQSGMEKAHVLEFALLDKNDDGAISAVEFSTGTPPDSLKSAFEAIDLNGNREIGPGEYAKAIALPEGRVGLSEEIIEFFESIDRNRDQSISLREFERRAPTRRGPGKGDKSEIIFRKIDSNDDWEISISEFAASHFAHDGPGFKPKGKGKAKGKGRK